jgi:hypothetical protein
MKPSKEILLLIILAGITLPAAADAPAYVGAGKCKDCHRTERQGKQYPIWETGLHAQAFNCLETEAAKPIASAAGVAGPADQAAACLKCHAPAFDKAPEFIAEGVTCETCHGPGSDYRKLNIMMNRDAAVKKGLIVHGSPDAIKALCMTCHAAAHGKTFDFQARWEKIKHVRPGK